MAEPVKPPQSQQRRRPYWWHIPNHKRAQPYQQNVHVHVPSATLKGSSGGYVEKY